MARKRHWLRRLWGRLALLQWSLQWAIERRWYRWSPFVGGFFIGFRGYAALIWHRLGCKLGWVPSQGDPKRPEKRWLTVPIYMGVQPGDLTPEGIARAKVEHPEWFGNGQT